MKDGGEGRGEKGNRVGYILPRLGLSVFSPSLILLTLTLSLINVHSLFLQPLKMRRRGYTHESLDNTDTI